MFCSKCGNEISDDSIFCGHCGNTITNINSNVSYTLPLNSNPESKVGKKHTKLIIAITSLIILTIAALIIILVIKPFSKSEKEEISEKKEEVIIVDHSDPAKLVDDFFKYAEQENENGLYSCFKRECINETSQGRIELLLSDIYHLKDDGGTFEYTQEDYFKTSILTESEEEPLKSEKLDQDKIESIGVINCSYSTHYNDGKFHNHSFSKDQTFRFYVMKYEDEWYIFYFNYFPDDYDKLIKF